MIKKCLVFTIVLFVSLSFFGISKAACPTSSDCSAYNIECGFLNSSFLCDAYSGWCGCPGVNCGGCGAGEVCDGNTGTCKTDCPTKSDCWIYDLECGWIDPGSMSSSWSGCSGFSCGSCGSNETCSSFTCAINCPDSSDCSSYGIECGVVDPGISGCSNVDCGGCGSGEVCSANKCCPVEYGYIEKNYVCTDSNGTKTTVDTQKIGSSSCAKVNCNNEECLCLNASNYCHDTYFADSCESQNACEGTKDPGCTQSNLYCSSNTYYNGCEDCAGTKPCNGIYCESPTYSCSSSNVWTQSSSLLINTCIDSTNNCNYVTVGTPGKGAGCWDEEHCGTATCKNSYDYEYCNGAEIWAKTMGYEDICRSNSLGCGENFKECHDYWVEDCKAGYTCKVTGVDTFGYDDAECIPKSSTWTEV